MRKTAKSKIQTSKSLEGSTFIIVLWIAFGLVSIALYFANSMNYELRASDNRVAGQTAEQAIEGAARYITRVLANLQTNGVMPDPSTFRTEAVPVGDAHFWLIGRETNDVTPSSQVFFGLVGEASKINLNTASSNMIYFLPRMTADLTTAILDWRDTNGGSGAFQTFYAMHNYANKDAPFESVDELKHLYGADMDILIGADLNRNGILDPNENDAGSTGSASPGILDYVTVYSREPNTYSNGTPRVSLQNVTPTGPLLNLLQSTVGSSRAQEILGNLFPQSSGRGPGGGGGRGGPPPVTVLTFRSPLQFYAASRMTSDEFAQIGSALTVTNGPYIQGRVNINTASSAVLSCLPGLSDNPGLAQTLVNYREQNPNSLGSIAWIVDALGQNNTTALQALSATDCMTTETYQFTADVAALGPFGRGYRRVRFVFDLSDGTPRIIYRQDLTHLGWALGKEVRQTWLMAKQQ
jgi:DNA uptake protein ComE-like DNA-binding protein